MTPSPIIGKVHDRDTSRPKPNASGPRAASAMPTIEVSFESSGVR